MKKKKHLILIGPMGSGKTSVGAQLRKRLSLKWIDTDQVFEQREKMSISDYFRVYGEGSFRRKESKVLSELLSSSTPMIISTGGGVVLSEDNRRQLRENGWVVLLEADCQERVCRLSLDKTRPLLQGGELQKTVHELSRERHGMYDFADWTIDTTHLHVEEVATRLAAKWKERSKGASVARS